MLDCSFDFILCSKSHHYLLNMCALVKGMLTVTIQHRWPGAYKISTSLDPSDIRCVFDKIGVGDFLISGLTSRRTLN